MIAVILLGGCSRVPGPAALDAPQKTDANALVRLPLPELLYADPVPADAPRRIVSMIPSVTELLFALGLGDRVVGRSDWCDWPPEVETRPALGKQQSISVERVADLHPDLVIFWKHLPDKTNRLTELFKLKVVTPGTENREEVFDGIRTVAEACKVPGRGQALLDHLRAGLVRVSEKYKARPRPRTLVVLDHNQAFFVPGKTSFVQDLLDICNVESVSARLDAGNWPSVSTEQVLDWNPELILDLSLAESSGPEQIAQARRYWKTHPTLDAVKTGRVIVLNAGVLVRPGPRLVAVAEALARIVHGAD